MTCKLYKEDSIDKIRKIRNKAEDYYSKKEDNKNNTFGIEGNTFRSYQGYENSPSTLYRNWAKNQIHENNLFYKISTINNRNDFIELHQNMCKSLSQYWEDNDKPIPLYQLNKLIDLFFKFLSRYNQPKLKNHSNKIVKFANNPLDKYVLIAVRELFFGIVVSKNPSMGDIKDKRTYDFIQNQIYSLMTEAELPNLYFDFYAWNLEH